MGLTTKLVRLANPIFRDIVSRLDNIQMALGRIETRQLNPHRSGRPGEYEFKVFSEWGEDGVIQYLINTVPIQQKAFVEFGVQNYQESNTRFLLQHDNWTGLVLDCSRPAIAELQQSPLFARYDLTAVHAWIDRANINGLLVANGMSGEIGLLSIDIDGNDYWIWEAIQCISPRIVVCEYNSLFGPIRKVSVPYKSDFDRFQAHYSGLYFGASIAALTGLAHEKNYSLIASNSNGSNLFFVRNDVLSTLPPCNPRDAYVPCKFRQSRDTAGRLTYLDFRRSLDLIADLSVFDFDQQRLVPIGSLDEV
jgi:hypothetical protein